MGTILGIPLSGFLAASLGWEAVFYVEGSMVIFFVGAWMIIAYDSPAQHPRISTKEKLYIEKNTSSTDKTQVKDFGYFIPVIWRNYVLFI